MRSLELRIPPPIFAALIALAMWPLSTTLPKVFVATQVRVATAIAIALVGGAFSIAGALAFRRAKTTVSPLRPERTSSLVTRGVYRITRNPMYVGLLLGLLAWAAGLSSPVSLAGPVAFIMFINRFQIEPEEKALLAKFGPEYETYKSTVRRWL